MFVWDCCSEVLCLMLLLFTVTNQQTNEDIRDRFPIDDSDVLQPGKISSDEESAAVTIPNDHLDKDPLKTLHHPHLMRLVQDQLQDHHGSEYGFEDQQQKREGDDVDTMIQKVFNPNSFQEHKTTDFNNKSYLQSDLPVAPRREEDSVKFQRNSLGNNPIKIVAIKDGMPQPERGIIKRRRFLKKLKSPLLRSSGPNSDPKSEQNSDEMLHNILESIDQDNSEQGDKIKHAFLTKTITYNISKLHEDSGNKSFIVEKIVNYTTNINILHAKSIPTNYSDSHSSVLQTILDLGQDEKGTRDFVENERNEKQLYGSSIDDNGVSNDIFGSKVRSDLGNDDSYILKTPTQKHQLPTEFVGGQYLQSQNRLSSGDSLQTDKNLYHHEIPEFVGGQFVIPEEKKSDDLSRTRNSKSNLIDFVGGQFIEQPLESEENLLQTSSSDFETTVTDDNVTQNPLLGIPSLSLTKELIEEERNVLKAGGKKEEQLMLEEDSRDTVNKPKKSIGTSTLGTTEGEENMLPKSNKDHYLKKKFPSSNVNNKPDTLNNIIESQFENSYSTSNPILKEDNKKHFKAMSVEQKIVKTNDFTSDDSELDDQKDIGGPKQTTAPVEYDTLQDRKTTKEPQNLDNPNYDEPSNLQRKFNPIPLSFEPLDENQESQFNMEIKGTDSSGFSVTSEEYNNTGEETVEEESELYTDTTKDFVGIKPTGNYRSILKSDIGTGKYVTEWYGDYATDQTTLPSSLEDSEPLSTSGSILKLTNVLPNSHGEDDPDTKALGIQRSKLQPEPTNTESSDVLSRDNEFSEEQNNTSLGHEVELYAGRGSISHPVPGDQTTRTHETESSGELETGNIGWGEKNSTELCFPISNEKLPTLLDLLSGKLYLEKDGRKTHLHLRGIPLKNCNSGSKVCKLSFDLKKSEESTMSDEMFEVTNDNTINQDLSLKSKNEKRHVTEENIEMMDANSETGRITDKASVKCPERVELGKVLSNENNVALSPAVDQSVTNEKELILNKTDVSEMSEPLVKVEPEQALFIKLPFPNKNSEAAIQNNGKDSTNDQNKIDFPINEERITLHDLDSPHHSHGFLSPSPFLRKIHRKRDSHGHTGGACGCNNPLLLSPSPVPDFRHFVGKRMTILKNIVHTMKDWAAQDALRA